MTNKEIETKYVWNEDIYGSLMNGNIAINPHFEEKKENSIIQIQDLVMNSTDELIDKLLEIDNWRATTIAGCLIGFKNRTKFIPQIGKRLVSQCGGVTGYCYALAKFSNEQSIHYLMQYLDEHLKFDKYPEEKYQDWVFSALRWTDKINKTSRSNQYLKKDGLWNRFVNTEYFKDRKLSDSKKWGDLDSTDLRFGLMMKYYEQNFETKGKAADNKL